MKFTIITLMASFLLVAGAQAQNTVWKSDLSHSNVKFGVDHMVISETEGQFTEFEVTALADKDDFSDASYEVTIQTASIDTENEQRDGHLKSGDFFDAGANPTITFTGSEFKKLDGKDYEVTGELSMHGVTKTVTLKGQFNGIIIDPWGNTLGRSESYRLWPHL